MKIIPYVSEQEEEKVVRVIVRSDKEGAITLEAVNTRGLFLSYLIRVSKKGIHCYRGVEPELGFETDQYGALYFLGTTG